MVPRCIKVSNSLPAARPVLVPATMRWPAASCCRDCARRGPASGLAARLSAAARAATATSLCAEAASRQTAGALVPPRCRGAPLQVRRLTVFVPPAPQWPEIRAFSTQGAVGAEPGGSSSSSSAAAPADVSEPGGSSEAVGAAGAHTDDGSSVASSSAGKLRSAGTAASVASSPDFMLAGGGLELESGPILADFLAMGAGAASGVRGASPVSPPLPKAAQHNGSGGELETPAVGAVRGRTAPAEIGEASARKARRSASEDVARAPLERKLVAYALQPRRPLPNVRAVAPPRVHMSNPPLRSAPGPVPALFSEGYSRYLESADALPGAAGKTQESAVGGGAMEEGKKKRVLAGGVSIASPSETRRLAMMDWHRPALLKTVCRDILRSFVRDVTGESRGAGANRQVIFVWEFQRAVEHVRNGEVTELLTYLAETELHMERGEERRERRQGGGEPSAEEAVRLKSERRRLAREWRLGSRGLEEDSVLRAFLDGRSSWPEVRALLGDAP
eukprot:TRINITY_DN27722_c0_g3_i2.p1 TRINITY_DN27722_c0_g3~~TRINITY_DN27722_c0_g3_i2.p1  ORF type:complete len:505 (-),score=102.86 TRINITY_DN27722_c0_g3_i2:53-1567(-)